MRTPADRPWALAGTLARLLRAHGEPTPCVEVLPEGETPAFDAYHRAALADSTLLWSHADAPVPA